MDDNGTWTATQRKKNCGNAASLPGRSGGDCRLCGGVLCVRTLVSLSTCVLRSQYHHTPLAPPPISTYLVLVPSWVTVMRALPTSRAASSVVWRTCRPGSSCSVWVSSALVLLVLPGSSRLETCLDAHEESDAWFYLPTMLQRAPGGKRGAAAGQRRTEAFSPCAIPNTLRP